MLQHTEALHLLGRQHWVATRTQLIDSGVSERALTRAIRSGSLDRVARRVVRLAGAPDTFESRAMQLLLSCGEDSYLSGATAASLWGVRGAQREPVEITIAHARKLVVPAWARLVRSSWLDPELHRYERPDGLVVSTPVRTLMRLAELFGDTPLGTMRFEKAAEDLWLKGFVTPSDARAFLAANRRSGRGGVAVFDAWLERTAARDQASQSHLEVAFAAALRARGLPDPERQYPLRVRGGVVFHLDLAYPPARLAIEPGATWWHGGTSAQRRDQARDRRCAEVGWQVMRFDEVELRDLDACARQCATVHANRLLGKVSDPHSPGKGDQSR